MKVVLINLTRFGDLLQMQPTILGLKEEGHEIGLLCLENFTAAAALLQGVDQIFSLPGNIFLKEVPQQWPLAVHAAEECMSAIARHFQPDKVINTTASLAARLLARRINIDICARKGEDVLIEGFGLDSDGFGESGNMWTTFLQGASAERLNCPFNIVDMFRALARVADKPARWGLRDISFQVTQASQAFLAEHAPKERQAGGFIGFQLGASEARRQWPVAHFARLGHALWHSLGLCPVLLGSPAEKNLADAYAVAVQEITVQEQKEERTCHSTPSPFVDAIGKTDIPHLAGVLSQCRLLVSNDTGTMHLAAGLGLPVLAIFLATAQAWDTGPYLPQCCCLEPAMPCHPCAFQQSCIYITDKDTEDADSIAAKQACLHHISSETVFALVRGYIENAVWPSLSQDEARVWCSEQDADGFINLHGLSVHEQEERTQWIRQQRFFYRRILDGSTDETDIPPSPKGLSSSLRQEAGQILQQSAALLLLLEEQAELLRRTGSAKAGENLVRTSQRLHTLLKQYPPLKTLGHLWMVISQEQSGNLESLRNVSAFLRTHLLYWHRSLTSVV